MYVCMYVCMYMYVCIYIYIYVYIHTYILSCKEHVDYTTCIMYDILIRL